MAEIWDLGSNPHGAEGVYYDPSGGSRISVAEALDGKQASDADLTAVAALSGTGLAARTTTDTWALRTITGTSARITITDGDGVAGNPTVDIASTYVGQTSITTLGTITTGVWNGTDIAVVDGGTGASTAEDARTNLGLVIGTDVQAHSAVLDATTASFLTADETKLDGIEAGADVTDASNVAAAGAHMSGGTDVPVTDGGTGASTAVDARTNLAVPGLADVNEYSATNTFTGHVHSNTFSASGATAGKQFNAVANSLDSSQAVTTTISHYRLYNPNGQVGSIQTNGSATSYNTSSDLALKDNIVDADGAAVTATLKAGRPVSFEFKTEPGVAHLGFIAQEMFDVFPDAISPPSEPGEPWMIDNSKLVPVLWAGFQGLLARIEALESA